MDNLQTLQAIFDALPNWEKESFLCNNSEQLISDMTSPNAKLNLEDIETENIVEWLLENKVLTCEELLDVVVENIDEFRDIMMESAAEDYESQDEILDEDEYYDTSDRPHTNYGFAEGFPF